MNNANDFMETRFSKNIRLFFTLCWAALAVEGRVSAHTSPGLDLKLYAGLSITGAVGTVYSVEYLTDVAQTNSWRCLEFLQPPASPYLWVDKSAPATGRRFYRSTVFAAPTNLGFIPPGTFMMGSLPVGLPLTRKGGRRAQPVAPAVAIGSAPARNFRSALRNVASLDTMGAAGFRVVLAPGQP